jgi:ribonuclease J
MVTNITFFGGIGEIGGNKILLEDKNTRIFLDFGTRMGFESEFFSEFLDTRSNTELKDKIAIGVLPKISGIFRGDLTKPRGVNSIDRSGTSYSRVLNSDSPYLSIDDMESYEEYLERNGKPYVNGILLSHAHLDHSGAIGYLHHTIPLYCSKDTEILINAIDDITTFKSEAITSKSNDIGFNKEKSYFPNSLKIVHTSELVRNCQTLENLQKITIGDMIVKHIAVDHSVVGASSYLIESTGLKILYTGDIRFHGTNPMTIDEYVSNIGTDIDIMICEGTRIDSKRTITEVEILDKITDRISNTKGIVFIDFSWKDTTRYATIKEAAKKSNRIFVINARLAYLLNKLGNFPIEDNVKVFLKRKDSCLYSPSDYTRSKHELGLSIDWKSGLDQTHYDNATIAQDIRDHPDKYVVMLSYFDLGQIFDLADENGKIPDSFFIKAQCEPFSDEMELDEERLINWLDTFGIGYDSGETPVPANCLNTDCPKLKNRLDRSHVSGHAAQPEIKELIEKIKPKILIPVHTEKPELFKQIIKEIQKDIKTIIPEYGMKYSF